MIRAIVSRFYHYSLRIYSFYELRASSVRWQFHKGCPLIRAIVSRFYHYSFNLLFYELVQFVGSFIKASLIRAIVSRFSLLFQFIFLRASSVRWQFHKGCPLIRAIVSRFYHFSFSLLFYELVQFVGSFIKAAR